MLVLNAYGLWLCLQDSNATQMDGKQDHKYLQDQNTNVMERSLLEG